MKKAWTSLGILLAVAAGGAHAGAYQVLQSSDCPAVSSGQLAQAVRKAGTAAGLDLPKDMALRMELLCAKDPQARNRFVYVIRAAIEKQLADGEQLRWTPVAQHTAYGTSTSSAALLRDVGFTVRDVVRQEP